ncbi:MAG TPA: pyridoxal-phosphate dependent enzyme [Streptosporangiaceae bacterium]|jgi:threonine dehydratase
MVDPLSLAQIEHAARTLDPVFGNTPQYLDAALSRRIGGDTVVKIETLNPIRSFKGRGAGTLMRGLPSGETVVCASAGNFGQAVAYCGAARGIAVRVFAATDANAAKVARMRELGAEVTLTGADFDAAKDAARTWAAEHGARYVEDGREPPIAEGAATIGVELAPLGLDAVVLPVGNGALITGVGRWLKEHAPRTRVIGVCAAEAPAMAASFRAGRAVPTASARTMADGIAVREPVPEAVAWMETTVDEILLVGEGSLAEALRVVRDTVGLLLEPAGAAGVAALLQYGFPGGTVGTVLTGGNLAPGLRAELTGAATG